jgi:phosphopantetheine--protein transferase-like protein
LIVGIGFDLERVAALEAAEALTAGGAFFTAAEHRYASRRRHAAATLTGHFAAKEALFKSLRGEAPFYWTDVEVVHGARRTARFRFSGALARHLSANGWEVKLSLTQRGEYAAAFVAVWAA